MVLACKSLAWAEPLQCWVELLHFWAEALQLWAEPLQFWAEPLQFWAEPLQRWAALLHFLAQPLKSVNKYIYKVLDLMTSRAVLKTFFSIRSVAKCSVYTFMKY